MKSLLTLLAVVTLCTTVSQADDKDAKPKPKRTVPFARLIRHKAVLKELEATEEQTKKLHDISVKAQKATRAATKLKGEERRKAARDANRELRSAVAETLKESQQKRLLQIELQYSSGSWIVARKEVAELIDLSRDQRKKIRQISNKMSADVRKLREAQDDTNKQETLRKVAARLAAGQQAALAELSPEQRKKWKAAQGEAFKLPRGKRRKKKQQQ